ncbi:MAG TPA: hypothetical protein VEL31_29585 [Ktedonobacteraceae bacterium]|nr:hypothetical protein [Ktedonobacteraceae bacterium]
MSADANGKQALEHSLVPAEEYQYGQQKNYRFDPPFRRNIGTTRWISFLKIVWGAVLHRRKTMQLIMARRIDPRTGWEAKHYKDEPRTIQLMIRDNGELHTRWGPVIAQRVEGQEVHMRERSSSNLREEDFVIPLAELERLQRAPDWPRLPDARPTAYWRKLFRERYATLALYPDPAGQLRGDYNLLTKNMPSKQNSMMSVHMTCATASAIAWRGPSHYTDLLNSWAMIH